MFKRALKRENRGREAAMATSTFDRKLILEDDSAIEKFMHIVNTEPSGRPLFRRAQTDDDRRRSETLLRQLPLH